MPRKHLETQRVPEEHQHDWQLLTKAQVGAGEQYDCLYICACGAERHEKEVRSSWTR